MFDVVVIGSGQAGLAAAYYLGKSKLKYLVVDKNSAIGDSWRQRYDSLKLFTPRIYSSLPGLSLHGEINGLPSKDEIADYLTTYREKHAIPVQLETDVYSLAAMENGFLIETSKGRISSKNIVVATGPFQTPYIPSFHDKIQHEIVQLHSSSYRNKKQLRPGNVLVIGAGNSGAQIAAELADDFDVYVSTSGKLAFKPLFFMGKSIFYYYNLFGLLDAGLESKRGKWLKRQPEQIYGLEMKKLISEKKIKLVSRTKDAFGDTVIFEDGKSMKVDNIIWATGFRQDFSWIDIPEVFNDFNQINHKNGVSNRHGLYFVGLPWLSSRGSALLGWVKNDAYHVVNHILQPPREQ